MNQQPQPHQPHPVDPTNVEPENPPITNDVPSESEPEATNVAPQAEVPVAAPVEPVVAPAPATNFQTTNSRISDSDLAEVGQSIKTISEAFSSRIVGQDNLRQALLVSLLTSSHVLLESVPGLAKTTAVQILASSVKASFRRIQCTPDLLPSDVIGTQIYDYAKGEFKTELGPVHANFILLDEINRSSAKTQSAMLEAMQEKQTSIGGVLYPLPKPFMVLATQNPIEQEGTYELPEAQLDRFLLKEVLVYPTQEEELEILKRIDSGILGDKAKTDDLPTVELEEVLKMQEITKMVYVDDSIKQYIVRLTDATRDPSRYIAPEVARYVQYGASPRASIAFQKVAKAIALINGRNYVIPEDVKAMRHSILRHRLILNFEAIADQVNPETIIEAIFAAVTTP